MTAQCPYCGSTDLVDDEPTKVECMDCGATGVCPPGDIDFAWASLADCQPIHNAQADADRDLDGAQ